MASDDSFRPDWTSPPSDTILDILAEKEISVAELAAELGYTEDTVQDLLQGRSTITLRTARSLRRFLGGSVQFWMTRDLQYRDDIASLTKTGRDWLNQLPVGDMMKFGWLGPIQDPANELEACLHFFDVSSVKEWQQAYDVLEQQIVFRTSPSFDSQPGAVAAWLRQGERESILDECAVWDRNGFEASLQQIRALTRIKEPTIFVPRLQRHCAKHGVAVSVVRAPAGCRASGATRLLPTGKALVLLSFRYLTDDHFWFTFFHEAGHLVLHDDQDFFLEGSDVKVVAKEDEANEVAASIWVPDKQTLLAVRPTARDIIRYAVRLGISPGIVVGQMQYHGRLRHNQLNQLKRRYRWSR